MTAVYRRSEASKIFAVFAAGTALGTFLVWKRNVINVDRKVSERANRKFSSTHHQQASGPVAAKAISSDEAELKRVSAIFSRLPQKGIIKAEQEICSAVRRPFPVNYFTSAMELIKKCNYSNTVMNVTWYSQDYSEEQTEPITVKLTKELEAAKQREQRETEAHEKMEKFLKFLKKRNINQSEDQTMVLAHNIDKGLPSADDRRDYEKVQEIIEKADLSNVMIMCVGFEGEQYTYPIGPRSDSVTQSAYFAKRAREDQEALIGFLDFLKSRNIE